jgi:mannose-6-phosphate isomerase-like protein (cupin superfamily)
MGIFLMTALIKNAAEYLWEQPDAGHHNGAYSKMLVTPANAATKHFDYRISSYQPKAHVQAHRHKIQEQIYHVLDGEGLMEIDGVRRVVKKQDVIFIPPGAEHALYNTGFTDLTFIVVTSPPHDADKII